MEVIWLASTLPGRISTGALDVCIGSTTVTVVFPARRSGYRELFAIPDSWIDGQEIDGNTDRNDKDCRYQSLQDGASTPRTDGILIS
jgi:hypothetical protein